MSTDFSLKNVSFNSSNTWVSNKPISRVFIDKDEFKEQIDEWIRVFRRSKPAPGTDGPLIPGDPEREAEAVRNKEGIPLLQPVVDDLLEISKKTGIEFVEVRKTFA